MKSQNHNLTTEFITKLKRLEFKGDIETRYSQCLVSATDNSIYQIVPQAILHPQDNGDVLIAMQLLGDAPFQTLSLTARGGGTGTNGQALTNGIVLDLSRYMNKILDFDEETQTVTVQAGVIKDQLNAYLKPFGYFFAPELSTSNRATIGGMINTDASGQGSCEYGKTSQHVKSITAVIYGGELIETQAFTREDLEKSYETPQVSLLKSLEWILTPYKNAINQNFPPLNRFITGYDLYHFINNRTLNLTHLFCGSEGSLGILTEAKVNVLPIPKETALVVIAYNDFLTALEDAPYLMLCNATSVEVLDNIIMDIAKNDYVWAATEHHFQGVDYDALKAIQLIEFNADTEGDLQRMIDQFMEHCAEKPNNNRLSLHPIIGKASVADIYALRKRAVGLLGAIQGERRPIPFVEDTAVPPENLAPYIREFKAILDEYHLAYGMFGHADAGVIHVRPALDLRLSEDQLLIREISDKVFTLCQKYGGVLWGEHGKGLRSEYSKLFFGSLYPVIQKVKELFDPMNQLNPGKIATPNNEALYQIDDVPLRGTFNRNIDPKFYEHYGDTLYCNGNGACFNYDLNAATCPSYKATRNRVHSPKGRAELIKEWLRQRSQGNVEETFEKEIYESFSLCLSCKSCTGECPMKVNIPDTKSEFLSVYYQKYSRPLHERLLAIAEDFAPLNYRYRALYNPLAANKLSKWLFQKIGLTDLPYLGTNQSAHFRKKGMITMLTEASLEKLNLIEDKTRAVIIIPDACFSYYDHVTYDATIALLCKLGVNVFMAPYQNSGKAYHVLGMIPQFKRSALKQNKWLEKLAKYEVAMVGIEPSITLFYRDEYKNKLSLNTPAVMLIQEWLHPYLEKYRSTLALTIKEPKTYQLLGHCTEKTNATNSLKSWQAIFTLLDNTLTLVASGCCGMSGTFGHIEKNQKMSKTIYENSWKTLINPHNNDHILATGFSCRSQVKRLSDQTIVHPLVKLNEIIE